LLNDHVVRAEIDKAFDNAIKLSEVPHVQERLAPFGLTREALKLALSLQLDSGSREPWARQVAVMLAHDYIAQAIESGILVALRGRNGGLWRAQDLPLRNVRRSEHCEVTRTQCDLHGEQECSPRVMPRVRIVESGEVRDILVNVTLAEASAHALRFLPREGDQALILEEDVCVMVVTR
jgi:hypothetical protein